MQSKYLAQIQWSPTNKAQVSSKSLSNTLDYNKHYCTQNKMSNKRPVHKHKAHTMSILFFIQHLPSNNSFVRDRSPHAWKTNTTLKTCKTLPKEEKLIESISFVDSIPQFRGGKKSKFSLCKNNLSHEA